MGRTKIAARFSKNVGHAAVAASGPDVLDSSGFVAHNDAKALDALHIPSTCTTIDEHLAMAEMLWQAFGTKGTDLGFPHYEAAAALAREAGDHERECMVSLGHGFALRQLGRHAAARALLRKAKRIAAKQEGAPCAAYVEQIFQMEIDEHSSDEKEATCDPPCVDVQSEAMICGNPSRKDTQRYSAKSKNGKKKKTKSKASIGSIVAHLRSQHSEDKSADIIGQRSSDQPEPMASPPDHADDPLIACEVSSLIPSSKDAGADVHIKAIDSEEMEDRDGADSKKASHRDNVGQFASAIAELAHRDATASSFESWSSDLVPSEAKGAVSVLDAEDIDDASCSRLSSEDSRSLAGSTDSASNCTNGQLGHCPSVAFSIGASVDTSADLDGKDIDHNSFTPRSSGSEEMVANDFLLPPLSPFLIDRLPFPSANVLRPPPGLDLPEPPNGETFLPLPGIPEPPFDGLCSDCSLCSSTRAAALAEENKFLWQLLAQQASDLAFMRHLLSKHVAS